MFATRLKFALKQSPVRWWLCFALLSFAAGAARAADEASVAAVVDQVTKRTGVDRGVCSMLGFDAPAALQLARSGNFLIHVLHPDGKAVAELRETAHGMGYGIDRVLIEQGDSGSLPYADNLIDLLLATKITDDDLASMEVEEIRRVLRPEGVAILGNATEQIDTERFAKAWYRESKTGMQFESDGSFVVLRKPAPAGMDDWAHWEHGPDNNPVSSDQLILAPYMTQFMAEPFYIGMPAITTAAGGRTFLATGHIAHHRREWDFLNKLIARNGYNGSVLWQRDLPDGFLAHRSAFIATKDTFHLVDGDGCLLLDAATGEEKGRLTIPGVDGDWKWVALHNGVLYVMAGPKGGEAKTIRGDRTYGGWSWADLSEGYYSQPRVPWGFGNVIAAYDVAQEKTLWKHKESELIDSRAMAMHAGRILVYCPEKHLRCLAAYSGEVLWENRDAKTRGLIEEPGKGLVSTPGFRSSCIAVGMPGAFILQGQTRMNVISLSSEDGELLWNKRKFTNNPNAICVDGKAILGVGDRGSHVVIDPVSGEELEDLNFRKVSCTRLTASTDSLFVRGEGTLRFDRESKKVLIDGGVRPACNDGAIPANGLLYIGPWACDCNLSLIGALARCSAGDFRFDVEATESERLQPGEGDLEELAPFEVTAEDWPTYRANNRRTASTPVQLPGPGAPDARPSTPQWAYVPSIAHTPTPAVAAGGMVFVSGSDGWVRALDEKTGQVAWQFATAGPIKAPPTIWRRQVFVGSGDGFVYALEAATGRLLWRFRAAPVERRIMVFGNLGSTWPVNTGVLVEDGVAYFAAGIIDQDGTYVYALDAKTGKIKWQNNTCGHLNPELRKGVSAQGNLTIHGDRLLMAGGNQVSPAAFDLATGRCLNQSFAQGQPKANHGRFIGVVNDEYPVAGGRVLYASPRNVANKDSFVLIRNGRPMSLAFGGVPPAWNDDVLAMVNFRNGKLACYDMDKSLARLQQGFAAQRPTDQPGQRWVSLAQALEADGANRWQSDLDNPNRFEILALAVTKKRIAAIVQLQVRIRAHPQWQVVVFHMEDGTPAWFWRHDLPFEPLPEGLAVGRKGQLLVSTLDGKLLSLAPKEPPNPTPNAR